MTDDLIVLARIRVDERTTVYRAGGEGPPVLFLHGWALGTRAYQQWCAG